MNLTILAVFLCAGVVMGGREDLVYRRPKSPYPGWVNRDKLERAIDSEPYNSIEERPLKSFKIPGSGSLESLDTTKVTLKSGRSKKPRLGNKMTMEGLAHITPDIFYSSSESREGLSTKNWYEPLDYDRPSRHDPRHYPTNKERTTTKKWPTTKPKFYPSSESDEMIETLNKYNGSVENHRDIVLATGVAPPYQEALNNFDAASDIIQSHFKRESFTYKENKDFRFVIIAVVVDGLSKIVAENGWEDYDMNYRNIVKALAEKAAMHPMESVDMIRCVFRKSHEGIQKIRNIINNKWTQAICKAQPVACNAVIYAQIKSNTKAGKGLDSKAHILIKLGESAATYLSYYASVFEAVSDLNAYQYLATGKEVLRNLVRKNAEVRNLLFQNGGPTADECGINSYY